MRMFSYTISNIEILIFVMTTSQNGKEPCLESIINNKQIAYFDKGIAWKMFHSHKNFKIISVYFSCEILGKLSPLIWSTRNQISDEEKCRKVELLSSRNIQISEIFLKNLFS